MVFAIVIRDRGWSVNMDAVALIRGHLCYLNIDDIVRDDWLAGPARTGRDGVVIYRCISVGPALAPAVVNYEPTRLVEFPNRSTDRVAVAKAPGGKPLIGRPCVAFFFVDEADDFQGHADVCPTKPVVVPKPVLKFVAPFVKLRQFASPRYGDRGHVPPSATTAAGESI